MEIETAKGEKPKVINIMDALKKSMQAKVRDTVRKRMGKESCFWEVGAGFETCQGDYRS